MRRPHIEDHLNMVLIGDIGSGKSTVAGHFVHKCGGIDESVWIGIEKGQEAMDKGRGSSKFAWVVDKLNSEREGGNTIEITYEKCKTVKFYHTIINAPGHADFIGSMIASISQADYAILVVSAGAGEFESGISRAGHVREHAQLAFSLGVKQLIVAVNKMDECDWSHDRYLEIDKEMRGILTKIGYPHNSYPLVTISGYYGDNLTEVTKRAEWDTIWKKSSNYGMIEGKTLVEALDMLEAPVFPSNHPLRIPIQNVYKTPDNQTTLVGRIFTGNIKAGMTVTIAPTNIAAKIESVSMHGEQLSEGIPSDMVHLKLKDDFVGEIHRGDVVGDHTDNSPMAAISFIAQITVLDHPGEISPGYSPTFYSHTTNFTGTIAELLEKLNPRNGKSLGSNPTSIQTGDSALVKVVPSKPICVESFTQYANLGRLVIRDMDKLVAVGVVKSVETST